MRTAAAILLAYAMLAGTFFLAIEGEDKIIDWRDSFMSELGFADDVLDIHTGLAACWYE
jgi:hypothetical protein